MFALVSLLILVGLFLMVARVAAVALETTGMARDSAQFQARSALMGVGFTTSEAEDITGHPQRRRVILWLMTFGNAGVVTGIASTLLAFVDTEASQTVRRTLILAAGLTIMIVLMHTKVANRLIEAGTKAALRRFTHLDTRDFSSLMRFEADYAVTELKAREGEWFVDRPLSELHLTKEGVVILGVHRVDGSFLGAPTGDTIIHVGDEILAYGRTGQLAELATRTVEEGDRAHERAMAEQYALLQRQIND